MQTKSFADKSVNASAQRSAIAQPSQIGPVELDPKLLQFVAGGGTPRGGWSATAALDTTTDTPRGGWL